MNFIYNVTDNCIFHTDSPSMRIDGVNLSCCQSGSKCKTETIKELVSTLKKLKRKLNQVEQDNRYLQDKNKKLKEEKEEIISRTLNKPNVNILNQYNTLNINIDDKLLSVSKGKFIELGRLAISARTDLYLSAKNYISSLPDTEQNKKLLNMYNDDLKQFKRMIVTIFQKEVDRYKPLDKDYLMKVSSDELNKIEEID